MRIGNIVEFYNHENCGEYLVKFGITWFTLPEFIFHVLPEDQMERWKKIPQYNIFHFSIYIFDRVLGMELRLNKTGKMRAK